MKGPIRQKRKDRPRKQRIKSWLKQVATENAVKLFPVMVLVADYLQDGQIDGFGLLQNPILGGWID
jgi:hypothetical protein